MCQALVNTGDSPVNKTRQGPCPYRAYNLVVCVCVSVCVCMHTCMQGVVLVIPIYV